MSTEEFEGSFYCAICILYYHRHHGAGCKLHPMCRKCFWGWRENNRERAKCTTCRQRMLPPPAHRFPPKDEEMLQYESFWSPKFEPPGSISLEFWKEHYDSTSDAVACAPVYKVDEIIGKKTPHQR